MKKSQFLFFASGITATIWFLIRVIPKPSRASYPCMRIAAPVMSGFVVYLLSLGGFAVFMRKARQNFLRARYFAAALMLFAALITGVFFMGHSAVMSHARGMSTGGPADGPNQPMGVGNGVHPGRVVWVWNPGATNADCVNIYELFKPGNTKWFLCNAGHVSFDGKNWTLHNENRQIPALDSKEVAFDNSDFGRELWLASPTGAYVASIPIDARSGATTYYAENSPISSAYVVSVAVGKGSLRWFGTPEGVTSYNQGEFTKNQNKD